MHGWGVNCCLKVCLCAPGCHPPRPHRREFLSADAQTCLVSNLQRSCFHKWAGLTNRAAASSYTPVQAQAGMHNNQCSPACLVPSVLHMKRRQCFT